METKYIRIKFKPLIKTIFNTDSYYTLEILPIVTCFENIDKIELEDEKKSIEYNVPVTYKIVVKKEEANDDSIKIYHSNIDLLSPTSQLSIDLSAGDIPRLLSESLVLYNSVDYVKKKNNLIFDVDLETNNIIKRLSEKREYMRNKIHLASLNLDSMKKYEKFNEIPKNDFCNRNTIKNFVNFNTQLANNKDYNTMKHKFRNQIGNVDSLEPDLVISQQKINHQITPLITNVYKNHADNFLGPSLNTYDTMDANVNFMMSYTKILSSNSLTMRTLPEQRVANFMRNMEREILPLMILLNDIKNKCLSSNIHLFTNKALYAESKQCNKVKPCDVRRLKSNRVIYSIVFPE